MTTKSREVIWGGRIRGADIRARGAWEAAQKAAREADRAEAEAWSIRMDGYGAPAQPSPTIDQCLRGGLGWLEANASATMCDTFPIPLSLSRELYCGILRSSLP
jgi:hypothetical protein